MPGSAHGVAVKLLEREGFETAVTSRGDEGVELFRKLDPELLMLDLSLPDMDGTEVCRQIRTFSDAYIIILSARDDELDKVIGLTVGADDYVTKPFSSRELTARIQTLQRRPRAKVDDGELRRFGDLAIDPHAREVSVGGVVVGLTKIEFDLLDLLSSSPRRTFARSQLLKLVWGEWYGDDHVIDTHVGNLRKKLRDASSGHD